MITGVRFRLSAITSAPSAVSLLFAEFDLVTWKDRFFLVVGTCFGLGYSPILPGTCGASLGLLQYLAIAWLLPTEPDHLILSVQSIALILVFAFWTGFTIGLGDWAEKYFGKKDSGIFVTDEVVGTVLTLLLFRIPGPWPCAPLLTILWAFPITRIIDILKVPPARKLEELPSGWGVVADDILGSVYAAALLHLVWYFQPAWFEFGERGA